MAAPSLYEAYLILNPVGARVVHVAVPHAGATARNASSSDAPKTIGGR